VMGGLWNCARRSAGENKLGHQLFQLFLQHQATPGHPQKSTIKGKSTCGLLMLLPRDPFRLVTNIQQVANQDTTMPGLKSKKVRAAIAASNRMRAQAKAQGASN
jgi:hypothetical protein